MLMCCNCVHRNGNRGIYLYFFGEDGKTRMPLRKFDDFLKSLHDEIVRLEFAHYDYQSKVCHTLMLHIITSSMHVKLPTVCFTVKHLA